MSDAATVTEPAQDRLASTLFLAVVFHGMVILGITFSADLPEPQSNTTSLEVTIITDPQPNQAEPQDPDYLAQNNQSGQGNTEQSVRAESALASTDPMDLLGDDAPPALEPGSPGEVPASAEVLTARATSDPQLQYQDEPAENPAELEQSLPTMLAPEESAEGVAPGEQTQVTGEGPRELFVSPTTRQSRIAAYLDSWKRRVERIGTLNYPADVRTQALLGNPTLEVAIRADGRLEEIVVRRSSGHKLLDQAALSILQMASPFEPFPDSIRSDYDVLRFAYEWRFSEAGGAPSTLTATPVAGSN